MLTASGKAGAHIRTATDALVAPLLGELLEIIAYELWIGTRMLVPACHVEGGSATVEAMAELEPPERSKPVKGRRSKRARLFLRNQYQSHIADPGELNPLLL